MAITVDHLGNKFNSQKEMCDHWRVSVNVFCNRFKRGNWSLEEALTSPIQQHKKVVDHLGNSFETQEEMCKYWNVSSCTFSSRIRNGWSTERALTEAVRDLQFIDHLGNQFRSLEEMCEHWKITTSSYGYRSRQGWSIEKILTTPHQNSNRITRDHTGKEFSSQAEMCRAWNITPTMFNSRRKQGWSIERILTTPSKRTRGPVTDFQGSTFKNIAEMCKHWKVPHLLYNSRIHNGWDNEKALTTPPGPTSNKEIIDPEGNKFTSYRSLCKHWNVSLDAFYRRVRSGKSIKEALAPTRKELQPYSKNRVNGIKLLSTSPIYVAADGMRFYLCDNRGQEEVFSADEVGDLLSLRKVG